MRDSALSSVVLPEPVPPEIRMLSRQRAAIFSSVAIAGEMLPLAAIVSSVIVFLENLRIEIDAPSIASGGMMMLTRLPSGRRASTSGRDSSMRRPMRVTILVADVHQVRVVAELHVGQFELAAPLDIDLLRPVDHDVADGLVGDQRLKRPEPQHVGDQRLDQLALLGEIQLDLGLGQQFLDPAGQLRLEGRRAAFRPRRRRPCVRARAAGSAPWPPRSPPCAGCAGSPPRGRPASAASA